MVVEGGDNRPHRPLCQTGPDGRSSVKGVRGTVVFGDRVELELRDPNKTKLESNDTTR